jgi:hypothetical protein
MWVADLRLAPPSDLFRCTCGRGRRCDYHRADWPLIATVVLDEFRGRFGDGPVDWQVAMDQALPPVERRLRRRWHRLAQGFAVSLFVDPLHATSTQWTNGQHRADAMLQAGVLQTRVMA